MENLKGLVIFARTIHLGGDPAQIFQGFIGFLMIGIAWFITTQIRAKKVEKGEEPKGSGCGMMIIIWLPLAIISGLIMQGLS